MSASISYTDEEKDFILANYRWHSKRWDGWEPLLKRHSWDGIRNKAYQLGCGKRTNWTVKEELFLVERFAEIAAELGRTPLACSKRLASMTDPSYRKGRTGEWSRVPVTTHEMRGVSVE